MKRKTIVCVLLVFLLANLLIFAGCNAIEENKGLSLKESAIIMSNDILSDKLNTNFSADVNQELYDFTGEFNYLFCYDEELDYYAIYNMDSGKIMERSNGNIYEGYTNYKCYYGGYGSYFYQIDNMIYSLTDDSSSLIDDALEYFMEYSKNLNQSCIEDSEFKSRNDIKTYVENILYQDGVLISKCGKENRGNGYGFCIYDDFYSFMTICNSNYTGPIANSSNNTCYVDGYEIGFSEFHCYNGTSWWDTIFPINDGGSCSFVAATMMLQYYERNEILKTIPFESYLGTEMLLQKGKSYTRSQILSEKIHSTLIAANGGEKSASYVSVKNAINYYFSHYGITGISATSSASWSGLKAAIDAGNPCVITVMNLAKLDVLSNNWYDFETVNLDSAHAMYTYGYTANSSGVLDEFICHMGWVTTDKYYSSTYVSKLYVTGNVRLLY